MNRLGGLARRMPHTTALFLIGAASISGLPPFNGFASKWLIYQACYTKAVESGNIGFLFVTVIALITSALTLASFVKVSQSVFFGRLPVACENAKEVPLSMRLAMGVFALLCVVTGLFPETVSRTLTLPAAQAVANVDRYIAVAMETQLPAVRTVSASIPGAWSPINWLLLLGVALLGITLAALLGRYDQVSETESGDAAPAGAEGKYDLFFGGEKSEFSQVAGGDLFWGFKYNWRRYFSRMHELHSGVVNDYALWAVVALAAVVLFLQIAL